MDFGNFRKPADKTPKKEKEKCEIELKRDKDGKIIKKGISGSCSPAQLKALGMASGSVISEELNN